MATISPSFPRSPADFSREIAPVTSAGSVLDLVGNTPLLEISRLTAGLLRPGVRIFAKLEGFNPGGSVKDRPARKMIEVGIERGELRPGKTILESTSGNTGIALAMLGAALNYPVELVMASNVSRERKKILDAFGARVIYSSPLEGSDGAILLSREIYERAPEKYFKPDQYANEANPLAHFETTGPEVWNQTEGGVTHFVAGIGTGGTVMGAGRYLKSRDKAIRIIAVEPDDAMHGLEGLKHMASSMVPSIYHERTTRRKNPGLDRGRLRYGVRAWAGRRHSGRAIVGRGDGGGAQGRPWVARRHGSHGLRRLRRQVSLDQPLDRLAVMESGKTAKVAWQMNQERLHERYYLTYPRNLIREPILYQLVKKFDLVFNIRGASVSEEMGLVAVEFQGSAEQIESAINWLRQTGVTVEPIEKNVIE